MYAHPLTPDADGELSLKIYAVWSTYFVIRRDDYEHEWTVTGELDGGVWTVRGWPDRDYAVFTWRNRSAMSAALKFLDEMRKIYEDGKNAKNLQQPK